MLNKLYSIFRRRPPERALICDLEIGKFQCIEGDAIAIGAPLPAPFSGTECATLSVLNRHPLKADFSNGGVLHKWTPAKQFVFHPTFYVRDESGLVRIERCKRTQVFAHRFDAKSVPPLDRGENLTAFRAAFDDNSKALASFNRRVQSSSFSKTQWQEVVIAEGSRVRIEGLVRSSGEPLPITARVGFRDAPTMLELVAPRRKAMRITRIKRAE